PYKELAGVGVTFKLCQALAQRLGRDPEEVRSWVDLVMLGTVADVMPLTGENRALVRRGLQALPHLQRPGLVALAQVAGYNLEEVDAGRVAFGLAPRLNAAGRLGETELGVRLLLASDPAEAQFLAQRLEEANRQRQELEGRILAEAEALVAAEVDLAAERVLLLAARGWHPGVIGIVAARLVEKYHRPACLVALEDGWGRGSGRSVPAFNLHAALLRCADLLAGFGGHAQAAGFAVAEEALPELRSRLNRVAAEVLRPEDLQPELAVDAVVAPEEIGLALAEELRLLEPCGAGNPEPVLALRGVRIRRCHRIGTTGAHLRLRLTAGEGPAFLDAVGWGLGKEAEHLGCLQGELEVAFHLEVNTWRGAKSPRLVLCALRPRRVEPAPRGQRPAFYLVDGRGYPKERRPAYLERLLAVEERLLIYAAEREALDLASLYPGRISVYRERDGEEALRAVERWRCGEVPALAVVGPLNRPLSASATHLVFYTLPLSRWDFLQVGGWVAEAGAEEVHVHLLFGGQDVEAARAFLYRTAPDRELLRAIYRKLRAAADGTGRVALPFSPLAGEALAGWREAAAVGEEAVSAALDIFLELGLVEREGAGEKGKGEIVRLRPAPAQKLDLRLSVRYNEGVNKIESFEEFQRWILRAPAAAILEYLRKELRMRGSAGTHPRDTGLPQGRH
ncbi:MAG: DHHA1 domain-containing protein, partial [Bacillota bacterium]|nr:DHHA1 domain-containing protein [Bacillota bacterium]